MLLLLAACALAAAPRPAVPPPALVHPWLALVLTALRCPSCEAAGPLLPTGPAGLLLSCAGPALVAAGCLCAESQPEGPRCAPPPRRSPGAAQAVVRPNSGPQASSWTLRGPAGTVGPGKQVALHPVQAWPQAGGFGGCAATAAVRGRGRPRRVEARWHGRCLCLRFSCSGKGPAPNTQDSTRSQGLCFIQQPS